jgi:hypothetical protein
VILPEDMVVALLVQQWRKTSVARKYFCMTILVYTKLYQKYRFGALIISIKSSVFYDT